MNAWPIFLSSSFRRIVFFGEGNFSSSLASINPLLQQLIISSGLEFGVGLSGCIHNSSHAILRGGSTLFILSGVPSNGSLKTFARSRSRAVLKCCCHIGIAVVVRPTSITWMSFRRDSLGFAGVILIAAGKFSSVAGSSSRVLFGGVLDFLPTSC